MEEIIKKLLQRASEACYWKEDFENKAEAADTVELRNTWQDEAERWKQFENIWLEAVAIVKGERS